ncbi:hypothetical protein KY325_01085, partial [Candidatus Woesearchaeota archaeon]|nr:hypothetical protein [Candidatus Woesearchaeota archaeon]
NVHQLEIYRTKDGKEYKVIALFSDGKLDLYNLRGKERELFDFFNKEKESEAKEGEKEERRADGDEKEEEKDKDVEKKDREYEIAITGREKEEERKKPHFSPFSTIRRDYLSARDYEAVVRHLDYVEEELDVEDGDSLDKLIERYKAHLRGQELGEIAKDLPLRQRIQAAIDADVSAAERSGNKRFATLMRQNAQYAQASSVKAIDLRKAHLEQLLRTADMNTELKKRVQHDVANCEIYMRIYQNYINIITNDQKGLEEDYEWFRRKDKELLDNDLEETGYTAYARFMLAVSEQDREKRISALKGIFDRAEWLEDIYLDWLIPSVSTSQGSWTDSSGKEYNYRIDPQLRQRILRLLSSDLYNEASLMKKEHRLQSAADLCNSFLRQASLRNIVEGSWITAGVDAVTDFVFKIFDPEWYKITPREMKELRKLQEFISANPKNENAESIRSRIAYLKKKQDVHDGLLLLDDAKRNIQHNTRAGYDSALSYARQAFTLLEESSWESDARSLLEEIAGKQKRFRENDANIRKTAERVAQFADEAEKVDYQRILMLHITDRKGTELLEAGKRFLQRHPDSEHRLPVMGAIANAYFIMKNQEAFIETLEAMVSADSELKSSYARHAYRLLNDRKYNPYGSFDDARSSLSWRRVGYVFGIDDNTADWRSAREPISLAAHVAAKGLDGLKSLGVSYLISTGFRFPGAVFGDAVDNTRKINEGLHALQNPNLSKQRRAEINYSLASEFERKEDYARALLHYSQAMMYGYSDSESAIERLEAKTKRSVGDERKTVEAERRLLEERARLNEFFRFSGKEVRGFPRLLGEDGLNIDTTYIDGEHRNGEIADV